MIEILMEAVVGAFRARSTQGDLRQHPAWFDLDAAGREEAFEVALTQRTLEAALDPQGLSTTAHSVLHQIRGQ